MRRSTEYRDRDFGTGFIRDRQTHDRSGSDRHSYDPRREREAIWSMDEGRIEYRHEPYRQSGSASAARDAWDDRRSQFWGRGPKGYQRSDGRIYEDVCDRLTMTDVDVENIEVSVSDAEVTLSGTVRDRWDKRRAEDIAEAVSGVRDVHNQLRVSRDRNRTGMAT